MGAVLLDEYPWLASKRLREHEDALIAVQSPSNRKFEAQFRKLLRQMETKPRGTTALELKSGGDILKERHIYSHKRGLIDRAFTGNLSNKGLGGRRFLLPPQLQSIESGESYLS